MRFAYFAVLAFIVVGTLWLEAFLRTRVFRRWLRLLLSIAPVVVVFCLWDAYAIAAGHWDFDSDRVTGWRIGPLPIEEVAFFVVIPLAAILSLEAVRSVKRGRPGWSAGDESTHSSPATSDTPDLGAHDDAIPSSEAQRSGDAQRSGEES